MDFQEKLSKYAEVLVKIGLDLRKGQPVCIESPVEESVLAAEIARQAYLAGASEVEVLWKCDSLQAIQLAHQDLSVTQAHTALAEHCAAKGAGFIRLDTVDLTIFSGLSPEKVNQKAAADVAARSIFREKAGGCGQTIACVPTQSWADLVYPDLPQEQRLSALWDAVFACCRCDCADPVAAWKKYIADTTLRKQKLDSKQYQAFHYRSAKTDLTIAPVDHQMWMGGCMEMPDGRVFVPNIPTEEVFTTPNKYSANGYVSSTKPLNYRGQIIDGFKLYLENGKIVRYEAEQGEALLGSILDIDEGGRYFGEMALIDQASPIASLNRVFYTTLYDENASCHLAIGNAYGPNDAALREKLGFNDCQLHVDFMIGSDDMCIQGQLADGTWELIMSDGHWV